MAVVGYEIDLRTFKIKGLYLKLSSFGKLTFKNSDLRPKVEEDKDIKKPVDTGDNLEEVTTEF